jgi:hypothetical protein
MKMHHGNGGAARRRRPRSRRSRRPAEAACRHRPPDPSWLPAGNRTEGPRRVSRRAGEEQTTRLPAAAHRGRFRRIPPRRPVAPAPDGPRQPRHQWGTQTSSDRDDGGTLIRHAGV